MKNRITQSSMISQDRTSVNQNYRRLKKSSIRQYRKPLSPLEGSKSVQCRLTARSGSMHASMIHWSSLYYIRIIRLAWTILGKLDYQQSSIFPQGYQSERNASARENYPTREKARRVSPFPAWGNFHARSRFARSTIPEGKWGTARSLWANICVVRLVVRLKYKDV